ncbi:MAG: MarR family transcriptional regulator [Candidatus Acidiferrales bacterium]
MNPRDFITCLMSQLTHAMEHEMTSTAKELNLTLLQLAALAELNHDGTLSTADLARLTFVTPQNMSLTVSKLEAGGFLLRKPHPTNARINRLLLTPAGLKVLRKAFVRAVAIERQMFAGLSLKEKNELRAQLRRCLAGVKNPRVKKVPRRGTKILR